MSLINVALHYATDYGWAVLPVKRRAKTPAAHHGVKDASRKPSVITGWFQQDNFNIGVATGVISGIWVLDIDGDVGRASLTDLVKKHGALPRTLTCHTGGGGMHLYWSLPPHTTIRNRVAIAPGIDVRGEGGYVVAPPSIHESGVAYTWAHGLEAPLQAAPAWLLALIDTDSGAQPPVGRRDRDKADLKRYAAAALEAELARVAAATVGTRNDTLNRAAYALGQLVGAGWLDRSTTEAALIATAAGAGLGRSESRPTVRSGMQAGILKPRTLPQEEGAPAPVDVLGKPRPPADGTPAPVDVLGKPRPPADGAPATEQEVLHQKLLAAALTDKGNAECLALLEGDRLRYDHTSQRWRVWYGSHWELDQTGEVERMATAMVRQRRMLVEALPEPPLAALRFLRSSENQYRIRSALQSAEVLSQFATVIGQYDTHPFLACAGDVTLDLQTCVAREPRREDYITMKLGAEYDPAAQCPRWLAFLDEVFKHDAVLIAYMQRAVGYSLTDSTKEQKCWVCVGRGSNGKSVFLTILNKLLGDYAGSTPWETFDAVTTESRGDLAKLHGCRLVTVIETADDARFNEARIKSVTGNDRVTARALYANSFDYVPTYKIWFATNNRPRISGTDDGIWRRIELIPFTASFKGRMRDKDMEAKLLTELPGILNWALAGLAEWHRQGLDSPTLVQEATDEYRADSDVLGQWMTQCCVVGEGLTMTAGPAYDSYRSWCVASGLHAFSRVWLANKLKERGFSKTFNSKHQVVYTGLGLLSHSTPQGV